MKSRSVLACLVVLAALAACGDPGPVLSASEIRIIAPAPGRSASVAYLTIRNDGRATRLTAVSSPQFVSAELHETAIDNGVARMRPVPVLDIGADSILELRPGGLHIMLLDPLSAPLPGKSVTLRLEFESGDMLVVDAPLATRNGVD